MPTRKGQKGQKNIPYLHNEIKKKHTVLLTPTVWEKLKTMAETKGTSISEIIEQWVRGAGGAGGAGGVGGAGGAGEE